MTEIPRILGSRYEIGELIGRGGMAQVHIGYDTRLSRTVAIKVLRADLAADPTFLARFRREAQSAAALNHPAIVAVYDTGEEKIETSTGRIVSLPYIIMEYVRGRTASKLLSSGVALPIEEAVQVIVGVLSALEYSHQEGIVHRDIKPGNIMMTQDGKIKVMDFGIARAIADSAATMTSTNSVVGTAQYLSPEQARGEVVDSRSDLYSTGCLLYELLSGKPPFQGDSAVAVAYQHVSEAPKPPSTIAPDIPNVLDRIAMKSLAKRREARYQSAAEMRTDLLNAIQGGEVSAPQVNAWQTQVIPTPPRPSDATAVLNTAEAAPNTVTSIFDPNNGPDTTTNTAIPAVTPKKRISWLVWIAIITFLLVGTGIAIVMGAFGEDAPTAPAVAMVDVPDLSNTDEAAARRILKDAGLVFKLGKPVEDDEIPEGIFVSSNPAVGTQVKKNSTITVHFSGGKAEITVPDLTKRNLTESQARAELEALGLRTGAVERVDEPGVPEGIVFDMTPAPNSKVAKGDIITIVVGTGKVQLPNLVGAGFESAQNEINARKLTFDTIRENSDQPEGTVIRQEPLAGMVSYDTRVKLVISSGPAATPTPAPTPPSTDTGGNNSGGSSGEGGN